MPATSRKSKSASEKEHPTTSTPKIQKDGSGDEDEKDKFTGADQGSGDEGEVDHDEWANTSIMVYSIHQIRTFLVFS